MPEFILPGRDAPLFTALDQFTQGYIEALFFTSEDELKDAGFNEFDHATLDALVADCAAFQATHAALLADAYTRRDYSPIQAGRDYWFTRCGHGCGYWDRDALEPEGADYERLTAEMVANVTHSAAWYAALTKRNAIEAQSLGARLTAAAHAAGEVWAVLGDDGAVHVS